MKRKILVFGGTSEGRILCEALSESGMGADVCTATRYGGALVSDLPNIRVHSERLGAAEMAALIESEGFDTVVDATHPYACEVTLNIREACAESGAEYIRVARDALTAIPPGDEAEGEFPPITPVPDMSAAVDFLSTTQGRVLLATGSKDLHLFCRLEGFADRVYARVLPDADVIRRCNELGLGGGHIIAMQGPFTRQLNAALLRQYGCRYMVTKNTGRAGGLDDKLKAARDAGAEVVLVERPPEKCGDEPGGVACLTLNEVMELLGLDPFTGAGAGIFAGLFVGGRDEG